METPCVGNIITSPLHQFQPMVPTDSLIWPISGRDAGTLIFLTFWSRSRHFLARFWMLYVSFLLLPPDSLDLDPVEALLIMLELSPQFHVEHRVVGCPPEITEEQQLEEDRREERWEPDMYDGSDAEGPEPGENQGDDLLVEAELMSETEELDYENDEIEVVADESEDEAIAEPLPRKRPRLSTRRAPPSTPSPDTDLPEQPDVIKDMFFVLLKSVKMLRAFSGVIAIDVTHETNKFNYKLVNVIGIASCGRSFYIAHALISQEDADTFKWCFDRLSLPTKVPNSRPRCDLIRLCTGHQKWPQVKQTQW